MVLQTRAFPSSPGYFLFCYCFVQITSKHFFSFVIVGKIAIFIIMILLFIPPRLRLKTCWLLKDVWFERSSDWRLSAFDHRKSFFILVILVVVVHNHLSCVDATTWDFWEGTFGFVRVLREIYLGGMARECFALLYLLRYARQIVFVWAKILNDLV